MRVHMCTPYVSKQQHHTHTTPEHVSATAPFSLNTPLPYILYHIVSVRCAVHPLLHTGLCYGGYARIATAIKQARAADPEAIVLNLGDE